MSTDTYRELFYDKQNELLKAMRKALELQEIIKGYEMALEEVFKAYPQDIFPDTSQEERDDVIERYPGFIDRTSAMMGRHIAKVIRERAFHFANDIHEEQSCGRTLLALDVCPSCAGKGNYKIGVFSETCSACHGTGKRQ